MQQAGLFSTKIEIRWNVVLRMRDLFLKKKNSGPPFIDTLKWSWYRHMFGLKNCPNLWDIYFYIQQGRRRRHIYPVLMWIGQHVSVGLTQLSR